MEQGRYHAAPKKGAQCERGNCCRSPHIFPPPKVQSLFCFRFIGLKRATAPQTALGRAEARDRSNTRDCCHDDMTSKNARRLCYCTVGLGSGSIKPSHGGITFRIVASLPSLRRLFSCFSLSRSLCGKRRTAVSARCRFRDKKFIHRRFRFLHQRTMEECSSVHRRSDGSVAAQPRPMNRIPPDPDLEVNCLRAGRGGPLLYSSLITRQLVTTARNDPRGR